MNFKVDIDKYPTFVSMALLVCEIFLLILLGFGICFFIEWKMPNYSYFRALGVNIVLVLVLAYFNKENR